MEKISMPKLFITMFEISAFTFGGGFVITGMMQKKFCEELHAVSEDEVMDMTAIAQSAPGALAVNSAIIFGYRMRGIKGAVVSAAATVLPPLIIISVICMIYDAFCSSQIVQTALQVMRAGVAAVIADVTIDLLQHVLKQKDVINIVLMIGAFAASCFLGTGSIQIIACFVCIGILRYFLAERRNRA